MVELFGWKWHCPAPTVRSAIATARKVARDLRLLAGGHSFGGRMTSTAAYDSPLDGVQGLVYFASPLHQPGKPETKRAEHLSTVTVPMLPLAAGATNWRT
jgi:predicted alpha/beta-hydrolase family hydrolase